MIKHDIKTNRYVLNLLIAGDDSRLKAIEILTWLCRSGYENHTLDSTITSRQIALKEVLDSLKAHENLTMNYRIELRFSDEADAVYAMLRWLNN